MQAASGVIERSGKSSAGRQVLLWTNPNAGSHSRIDTIGAVEQHLIMAGYTVIRPSSPEDLAARAIAGQADQSLRAVVAAGGDGTVGLVLNQTPPGTPIVVLPLGTENLLAKYLEHSRDPAALVRIIEEGNLLSLDAGNANGRLFTLMAGCGFDGEVVRRLHRKRRGHIGHWSYAKPILDAIRTYEYPLLTVDYRAPGTPEGAWTGTVEARWVFVVNLPRYAGGLAISPTATGTDGLLDICTFKEGSLLSGLYYLSAVVFGQQGAVHDFVKVQATHLRVQTTGKVPFQLDGDPGGELPLDISIEPGRLTVLVSDHWLDRHAQ